VRVAFRARDAAAWAGARLRGGDPDARFEGVSIDTRTLTAGELFVAIRGPNHDAHDYLAAAAAAGAAGFLIETGRAVPEALARLPVLEAADTTRALGDLGAGHRAGFAGPVVAITGSNGKTTTKEMCAAILEAAGPALKTRGNLNNQFGLPLTLLSREPQHERIVVELGMNHRGEIAELARIAAPTIGAVTNIGTAHVEYLGSREAIAEEKGDLLAALPPSGTAVVNADDDFAESLAGRTRARVVRFGRGPGAAVRAEAVRSTPDGFAFELVAPQGRTAAGVAGLGDPTLANALCAAAAALAAGASLAQVAAGLAAYRPVHGRLERRRLASGIVLIDDSYNANPQSMEVALRLLAHSGSGRRIAVLGDMGELGPAAAKAHREAGRLVAALRLDHLVAVGALAPLVAEGAAEAGMPADRIAVVATSQEAARPVLALARPGDWVLIKGSRSMRMERVAEGLGPEANA
jgi:UDP-N-acetylmuramoyl-tripeptide--D-alanyl-D-alanine ligase